MQHRVYVFTMQRSGHHAVMNWLASHFSSHFRFDVVLHSPHARSHPSDTPELVLFNFEEQSNWPYADMLFDKSSRFCRWEMAKLGAVGCTRYRMLVLRDPYNLFASRLKTTGFSGLTAKDYDRVVGWWKGMAREMLGYTNHLRNAVHVSYNLWFLSAGYRRTIAGLFGKELNDAKLNDVPANGNGSSFDGCRFDGHAQDMKVLQRWKAMKDHPLMQRLMRDDEVRELADRLWTSKEGLP